MVMEVAPRSRALLGAMALLLASTKGDLRGVLEDDVLWLARKADDGLTEELRWAPGDGMPVLLVRHAGVVSRHGDDLEIFDDDAVPAPSEGSLDTQPLAGGPLVHLADHVHASRGWLGDEPMRVSPGFWSLTQRYRGLPLKAH